MNLVEMNFESFLEVNKGKFKESHILKIMGKLLRSLDFIHRAGVMHRDIKPENILINCDYDVLICDFGLARSIIFENAPNSLVKDGLIQNRDDIEKALIQDRPDRTRRERRLS